jgi:hypothetical protein
MNSINFVQIRFERTRQHNQQLRNCKERGAERSHVIESLVRRVGDEILDEL